MAHLIDAIIQTNENAIGYAVLTHTLHIQSCSPNFRDFASEPTWLTDLQGSYLPDVIWEFVGLENSITNLIHFHHKRLHLRHICREEENEPPKFFNFHLSADALVVNFEPHLLLVVEDRSQDYERLQEIIQVRNEFILSNERLARSNRTLTTQNQQKASRLQTTGSDLHTPVSLIASYLDLLQSQIGEQSRAGSQIIDMLNEQVLILSGLANDLAHFGANGEERIALDLRPVDLREPVQRVVDWLSINNHSTDPQIVLRLLDEPVLVDLDLPRFHHILLNLLTPVYPISGDKSNVVISLFRDSKSKLAILHLEIVFLYPDQNGMLPYLSPLPTPAAGLASSKQQEVIKGVVEAHCGTFQMVEKRNRTRYTITFPLSSSPPANDD